MFNQYYSRFIKATAGKLYLAAHNHHFWPDCTRKAMLQYWDDAAQMVDAKWAYIFSNVVPKVQKLIAEILKVNSYAQISFASNTHELIFRLLSSLDLSKPQRILTTDSEFHSFNRQINRLQEWSHITVDKVPTHPLETFEERFKIQIRKTDYTLILFSHVFFNSGYVVQDLVDIVNTIPNNKTIVAIDGYHAFMALSIDLYKIQNKIFYVAGGYKYAQAGEGCCFMYSPEKNTLRPLYTGWLADFDNLEKKGRNEAVTYNDNGYRFAGSTMDFCALYQLLSVLALLKDENISIENIHDFSKQMQHRFISKLPKNGLISKDTLLLNNLDSIGNFLTFKVPTQQECLNVYQQLLNKNIYSDFRGKSIRFGFGMYLDPDTPFDFLTALQN